MNPVATSRFWTCYQDLTAEARVQADKQFALLKLNPSHSSVRLKKVGRFWSARVSLSVRALAIEDQGTFVCFWIGKPLPI